MDLSNIRYKRLSFSLYGIIEEFGGKSRWAPYAIFIISVLIVFPTLSRSGLSDWDEATYASVARAIYRTGDFFHLNLGDAPYSNKPPLFMILTALVYNVMGINEFSARFIAAVFGAGNVLLGYVLIKKLFGSKEAFIAAILLLSNYHFISIVQHGRMESMASFFIMLSCYSIVKCREDSRWLSAFFISMLLGILTKGPLGFMPLFIAIPYLYFDENARYNFFKSKYLSINLAAFIFLASAWFYSQHRIYGQQYLDNFLGYQIIKRMTYPIEGHEGSPFVYFWVIMFKELSPWALLMPVSTAFLLYKSINHKSMDLWFMTIYLLVVFTIFSLIRTKLHWYIFSIYAPLAYSCVFLMKHLRGNLKILRELIVAVSILQILLFNLNVPAKHLSLKEMSPLFKKFLSNKDTITAYNMNFPALYFYADCNVRIVNNEDEFKSGLETPDRFFIAKDGDFKQIRLAEKKNIHILGKTEKHVFFKTSNNAL